MPVRNSLLRAFDVDARMTGILEGQVPDLVNAGSGAGVRKRRAARDVLREPAKDMVRAPASNFVRHLNIDERRDVTSAAPAPTTPRRGRPSVSPSCPS